MIIQEHEFEMYAGLPIQYKKLNIYPVNLCDSKKFNECVSCLMIPKDKSPYIEIIKMNYLTYILSMGQIEGQEFLLQMFDDLIKLVFHIDTYEVQQVGDSYILVINDIKISGTDFDKIKKIILEQNMIDSDDVLRDEELEVKIQEAKMFVAKKNNKIANIPQQLVIYHCLSGLSYEEILKLTIFQFHQGILRFDHLKNADILQNARYNPWLSFKNDSLLPTWLSPIEINDKSDDVVISKKDAIQTLSNKGISDSK